MCFEPIYIPRALNTGTCIRQGDLFCSVGLHRNHVLVTANTGKLGRGFGNKKMQVKEPEGFSKTFYYAWSRSEYSSACCAYCHHFCLIQPPRTILFTFTLYNSIVPKGFFPREIRVAFPAPPNLRCMLGVSVFPQFAEL